MADAAQTQYDPVRFGVALFDGQALRLERSGLSNWRLVFQSIRMAFSVHVRGLVCAWWIGTGDAIRSRTALVLGTAYLLFALVMTMAARFDELRSLIPPEIYGAFNPNDKTNLAPYRLLHFVVFAFFVVRLLPRDWPGLEWRVFRPAIKCGQQSLEVFCTGIFLSFAAHFVLVEISGAIWMQIVVSIVGILMMTALAYYRSWSKNADKAPTKIKPIVAAAG